MMIAFEENEYVIHVVHKHWFVFAMRLFAIVVASLFPLLIILAIGFIPNIDPIQASKLFTMFYALFLLFMWMVGFVMWTDYYLDMLIITNMRIMEVEQKGLFDREISTIRFETIQEIGVEVEGILPTFLGFGDLYIQTAATNREFTMEQITDPAIVKEIISRELTRIVGKDK